MIYLNVFFSIIIIGYAYFFLGGGFIGKNINEDFND